MLSVVRLNVIMLNVVAPTGPGPYDHSVSDEENSFITLTGGRGSVRQNGGR